MFCNQFEDVSEMTAITNAVCSNVYVFSGAFSGSLGAFFGFFEHGGSWMKAAINMIIYHHQFFLVSANILTNKINPVYLVVQCYNV